MFIGPRTYVPTPYEHMWKAPRTYVLENTVTEGDWYVSYDKTLFGREKGRYKKEQSEPLMNSSSLYSLRMSIFVCHS
jgi:hypothetical protein